MAGGASGLWRRRARTCPKQGVKDDELKCELAASLSEELVKFLTDSPIPLIL